MLNTNHCLKYRSEKLFQSCYQPAFARCHRSTTVGILK